MCFLRCPSRRVSWDAPQAAFCWGLRGGLQVSKFFVAPRFSLLGAFFSFFLMGSVGNVSRGFRMRFSKARFRVAFVAIPEERTWRQGFPCWRHFFLSF